MNPWGPQWPGYYQQPAHPHVYIPPQPYGHPPAGYWDQSGWGFPAETVAAPGTRFSYSDDSYGLTRWTAAGYRSPRYPNLNPILAADTTLLRFDVKKKPRSEILASTYYSNRHSPATATSVTHMRLISKAFPWTIEIKSPTAITCELVWDALYAALQEHIADSEWGLIIGDKKERGATEKAAKKRAEVDSDKRLKRIDWLGDATSFKGLEKDDDFEKLRLLPGSEGCSDTWVVLFGS